MTKVTKMTKKIMVLIALLALMLPARLALAASLKQLSAEFAARNLSIPTSVNPKVDTSGANCMVGQSGSVWVLQGQFLLTPPPITRTCSIPQGVSLWVGVIDLFADNTPGLCGQGPEPLSVKQLRALIKPFVDEATDLSVEVDGKAVKKINRVQSVPYVVAQPADNVVGQICPPGESPAGVFSPAIEDGYYVLLKPLSVGSHTLHFTASIPSLSYSEDVTYDLTVVPVTKK